MTLGAFGVRVNAIAPGFTASRLTEQRFADGDFRASLLDRIPLGYAGQPDDIARVALFVCSPDAAYLTGVVIPVDGGFSASNGALTSSDGRPPRAVSRPVLPPGGARVFVTLAVSLALHASYERGHRVTKREPICPRRPDVRQGAQPTISPDGARGGPESLVRLCFPNQNQPLARGFLRQSQADLNP